jgi:hypothetical protein
MTASVVVVVVAAAAADQLDYGGSLARQRRIQSVTSATSSETER